MTKRERSGLVILRGVAEAMTAPLMTSNATRRMTTIAGSTATDPEIRAACAWIHRQLKLDDRRRRPRGQYRR